MHINLHLCVYTDMRLDFGVGTDSLVILGVRTTGGQWSSLMTLLELFQYLGPHQRGASNGAENEEIPYISIADTMRFTKVKKYWDSKLTEGSSDGTRPVDNTGDST